MNNQDNMDDDVMNILAILQQTPVEDKPEPNKKIKETAKEVSSKTPSKVSKKDTPSVSEEKKEVKAVIKSEPKSTFLMSVDEPEDKSIYNSKVLIREEIYEIFMSLKRIKKFKSVSTLIDSALEEYIKNHRDDIKQTLYNSKNHEIL
jgi:hypothetical protein